MTGKNLPYKEITIKEEFGTVLCRYYPAPEKRYGAIFVGGIGGDWDTPAGDLYPRLCEDLLEMGFSSLRVRFRNPIDLGGSVEDVGAGLEFLAGETVTETALVGHSFGGAVVIQAAAKSKYARALVTLATQAYGTEPIADMDIPILLIHGTADKTLAPSNSRMVYELANGTKRIEIIEGAGHGLEEAAPRVYSLIRDWLGDVLVRNIPSGMKRSEK